MDPTAEYPQNPEIEKAPLPRIGFLGSNAVFLGMKLDNKMGPNKTPPVFELSYPDFKERLNRMRKYNQYTPRVVVTDMILKKDAEELNSQGISLIVINQNKKKDLSFLTSENPQRKVKNEVIAVESIDSEHMEDLLPKVAEAIRNLTQ